MSKKIVFIFVVLSLLFIANQVDAQRKIDSKYLIRTFIDENGDQIDEIIVPGRPPKDYRAPIAEPTEATVTLTNVPAFDWVYGCSATSGAMMAGYYDNGSYTNMYAGPTNGGVCPMNNSAWGCLAGECPLSATHQGFDGLGVRGHADDYWYSYGSSNDPYIDDPGGGWPEHTQGDCTGDYMGTNQFYNWQNTDGATTFYFNSGGTPLYDYTACEPAQKDGCHGLRQFFESRGYSIQTNGNYSQLIQEYVSGGFTYAQFKAEIDDGRPVLIQVEGHTMLGYGYDDTSNLVYLHDTWDYNNHTMTWGGTYGTPPDEMLHYAVGVFVLEPTGAPGVPTTPNPTDGATGISIDTMISWTNGANTDDVDVYFSSNQTLVTSKDASVRIYSGMAISTIDPSGVGSLDYNTTYYWRIVCKNSADAETDGPVWSFTTESQGGTPATLSYHNMDAFYYWHCPDQYNDDEFGVRYTPADACDLDSLTVYFNATVGSPTGITIHIYDVDYGTNASGLPNVELASLPVNIADININAWTTIDLRSLNLSFLAGDEFFITYTVDGGEYNVTEVQILSDQGSAAPYRSVENCAGTWGYMLNDWGVDVSFLMSAHVFYTVVIPPTLVINPSSIDFQRTAINGYKTQTVTLENTGGGQVVINSVSIAGDIQIELYDSNTYPDTLFNGESISFIVVYGPDAVETNSATITVSETSSRADHFIPITGEGYNHNSWASGSPVFDQPPTGNQGDYGWSMVTSDAAPNYLHAENFWSIPEPITAIEFWGINWYYDAGWHISDVEDPMTFEIKFYEDHATEYSPATEVASFSIPLNRTLVDTVTFSGGPVYKYRAEFPTSVVLTDGWVSIRGTSVSSPIDPWFLWSQSPVGDHANVTYDYGNSEWDFYEIDLAFALYTDVPLPPADVAVSISGSDAIVTWTPEAGRNYKVYSDSDPYGSFSTLAGTVTDGSGTFTDPVGTNEKKFYRVTTVTHQVRESIKVAPALYKSKFIRSIEDSTLMNDRELKK